LVGRFGVASSSLPVVVVAGSASWLVVAVPGSVVRSGLLPAGSSVVAVVGAVGLSFVGGFGVGASAVLVVVPVSAVRAVGSGASVRSAWLAAWSAAGSSSWSVVALSCPAWVRRSWPASLAV
jgi:hypothetical protein